MTRDFRNYVYVERVHVLERCHDIKYDYVVLCNHE